MPERQTTRLVCAACGYDRSGTPERACPECGSTADPVLETIHTADTVRYPGRVLAPIITVFLMGALLFIRFEQFRQRKGGGVDFGVCYLVILLPMALCAFPVEAWAQRPIPGDPAERRARGFAAGLYCWGTSALTVAICICGLLGM